MLIGQYKSKLTQKNRIAVPKKLREELSDHLILANWYENCIVLIDNERWQNLLQRLSGKEKLVISPVRDIDRFVIGSAYEIDIDAQGRFILPEALKDFAEIGEDIVFVGLGDRIEIWSLESWNKFQIGIEDKANKALEKLSISQK